MPQAIAAAAVWVGNAIATGVGTALTATGVTAAVGTTTAITIATTIGAAAMHVSQIALAAGLQMMIDDIAHDKIAPGGSELNLRIDPDMSREMVVGVRATGGSLVARYSRGGTLYNAHFVYQLADHPCVELSKVYGDGRIVQDSPLVHGTRTEITAYSYSGGARVWMTWHDGRPGQAADSDLVTKSAQDPDVVAGTIDGWTVNHRGAGCAYVHIEVQYDSDILTSIPQFLFLVKGAKFYDRRLDTTAGGSGAHRIDDPSTWEYTTNAMVALDHYLLGYMVEDDALAFGIGLRKSEVPYDQFAAAADLCDEDVDTGVGGGVETIKRYEANGVISCGDYFETVIDTFQNQMAARVVDLGGRIGILGAEERTPVVDLTDDDWVSDTSVQFADKLAFSELTGAVEGSFADPANLWQPTPYVRQVTDYLALPDGGEATARQLDLPLETHPRRAVRLASAWLAREGLQPRLMGTFLPSAWALEPGDWFNLTSARLQIEAESFEVIDIVKHDDFTVSITARAINPDFLAFDNDNDPDLSVPPEVDPVDLLLDEPGGVIVAITHTGGGVTEPALRFTLTTIDPLARELVIEVRQWLGPGAEVFTGDPIIAVAHSEQTITLIRAGILPDKSYKARIKARAGIRESPWSAWSSAVTTSTDYTVPGSGLAAAIVGQGDLATVDIVTGSYLAPNDLSNMIADPGFLDTAYWTLAGGAAYDTSSVITTTLGAPKGIKHAALGTVGQSDSFARSSISAAPIMVEAGKVYAISMSQRKVAGTTGSAGALVLWLDRSYGILSSAAVFGAAGTAGADSTENLLGAVTAPAGAFFAAFYNYASWTPAVTTAGAFYQTRPRMRRALHLGTMLVAEDGTTLLTNGTVITSLGTAAAIIGQGWGATASEAAARATRGRGLIKNSRFQEPYTGSGIPPQWADWANGYGSFAARTFGDGYCHSLVGIASNNGGVVQNGQGVQALTDYLLCIELALGSGTLAGGGIYCQWLNNVGAHISAEQISFSTDAATTGVVSTSPYGPVRYERLVTSPAGAYSANFYVMNHWTGFGTIPAAANTIQWYEADLIPMTLVRQLRADITASNTAAAIAGQGWGATASETNASNAKVPAYGANLIRRTRFHSSTYGWEVAYNDTGVTQQFTREVDSNAEPYIFLRALGSPANGKLLYIGNKHTENPIPVTPGDRYEISADLSWIAGGPTAGFVATWLNEAGTGIAQTSLGTTGSGGSWNWCGNFDTAPTLARYLLIYAITQTAGSVANPYIGMRRPFVGRARSGQTVLSDYFPSAESELDADVTLVHTAGAISGQGNFATGNWYRQSSDPGGVEGRWWADTTTNTLKLYTGGAWNIIATIGAAGITATASPSSVTSVHTGSSFTSGTITITPAGGTSYTYAVTFVKSGGAGTVALSATNAASFIATATLSSGQDVAGGIIVTVFDSGGASCSIRIPLNFTRTD